MANYTALVDVKVDVGRTNKAFKNIEGSLLRVSKQTKSTNRFLSQMEGTFGKMQKSMLITAQANRTAVRQLKALNKEARDNSLTIDKLKKEVKQLNTELDKLKPRGLQIGRVFKNLGKVYKENAYLIQSLTSAFFGFIQYNLIGALRRMTDQFILMTNRVRIVNQEAKALDQNLKNVFKIAQETRQPLFAVGNTLARIGRNSKVLRTDLTRLARITSTVGKSFQIAGATIEEANNAMIQLSQAFASGRLQGDELRSVLELAPRLAQAISNSIGITVGQMRQFAKEGKLTTRVLEQAIVEASAKIDKEFKTIQMTIGQSLTLISNSLMMLAGNTDKITKTNKKFADAFKRISQAIDRLANNKAVLKLGGFLNSIADNLEKIIEVGAILVASGVLTAIAVGFTAIVRSLSPMLGIFMVVSTTLYLLYEHFMKLDPKNLPLNDLGNNVKDNAKLIRQNIATIGKSITELEIQLQELKKSGGDIEGGSLLHWIFGARRTAKGAKKGGASLEAMKITETLKKLRKDLTFWKEKELEVDKKLTDEAKIQEGLARKIFLAESQRQATQAKNVADRYATGMGRVQTAKRDPTKELQRTTNQISEILVREERKIAKILNKIVEKQIQASAVLPPSGAMMDRTGKIDVDRIMREQEGNVKTSVRSGAAGGAASDLIREQLKKDLAGIGASAQAEIDAITTTFLQGRNQLIRGITDSNKQMFESLYGGGKSLYGKPAGTAREVMGEPGMEKYKPSVLQSMTRGVQMTTGVKGVSGEEARRDALKLEIELEQERQKMLFERTIDLSKLSGDELIAHNAAMGQLKGQIKRNKELNEQIKARRMLEAAEARGRADAVGIKAQEQITGRHGVMQSPGMKALGFGSAGVSGTQKGMVGTYNNAVIAAAKKYGVELKSIQSKTESITNFGFTQLDLDVEKSGLQGDRLKGLQQEIDNADALLDAGIKMTDQQKQQAIADTAVSGVAGAGPSAGRAASMGKAYAAGGGGLTGAINALVEMLLGNKKVMAAIEKIFGMVFDLFDLFMDPIGELSDAIGTVLKPVFNILRPIFQAFGKLFKILQQVLKPIGQIMEMLNMFIAPLMAVMQAILGFINALVGGLIESIIQPIIDGLAKVFGLDMTGYKPEVLLREEEKILKEIGTALEDAADALQKINDVVFDITQSALNLAAPAIKAEDATAEYEKLKTAAKAAGATQEAIDEFTGYASTYLQVQQDILKSSGAYQSIYESVIDDLNNLNESISTSVGETLTKTLAKATMDLDLVGSDLGHVIRGLAQQMTGGAITFGQILDWVSFKTGQVGEDLSLYDMLANTEMGEDAQHIKNVYEQSMGAAVSGYGGMKLTSGYSFTGGSTGTGLMAHDQNVGAAIAMDFKAMGIEALVVNPQHYAVGLTRNSDGTVSISAIGEDAVALEMIAAASANGVPIIRDPATARALATGQGGDLSGLSFGGATAVISGTNAIAPKIGDLGSGVSAAPTPLDAAKGLFSLPDMDIGAMFEALVQGIIEGIGKAWELITDLAGKLMWAVFGWIEKLRLGIGEFMNAIFQPIFDLIGKINIGDFIFGIFQPIIKLGSINPADWIMGIFSPMRGLSIDGGEFLEKLLSLFSFGGDFNLGGIFENMFSGLTDLFSGDIFGLGSLSDGMDTYTNYITEVFDQTVGFITDIFKLDFGSAGQRITDAFSNIGKIFEDGLSGLGLDFGDIGSKLQTAVSDLFSGNMFGGFDLNLGGMLQDAVKKIFSLGGGSGDEIKLLPNPFHALNIGPSHFIKFKFAQGGDLQGLAKGPSHGSGGIPGIVGGRTPIEFEGGEFIMSKRAVDNIGVGPMNMINEAGKSYANGGATKADAERLSGVSSTDTPTFFNVSPEVGGTVGNALKQLGLPRGFKFNVNPLGASGGLIYYDGGLTIGSAQSKLMGRGSGTMHGTNSYGGLSTVQGAGTPFANPFRPYEDAETIVTEIPLPPMPHMLDPSLGLLSSVIGKGRSVARGDIAGGLGLGLTDFLNWYKWGTPKGPGHPESKISAPAYEQWQEEMFNTAGGYTQTGTFTRSKLNDRSSLGHWMSTRTGVPSSLADGGIIQTRSLSDNFIDYSRVPKDALFLPSMGFQERWGHATSVDPSDEDKLKYRLTTGENWDASGKSILKKGNPVYGGSRKLNPWMDVWRLGDSQLLTANIFSTRFASNPYFFGSREKLPEYAHSPWLNGSPMSNYAGYEWANPYAHIEAQSHYTSSHGSLSQSTPDELATYLAMSFGLGQSPSSIPKSDLDILRGDHLPNVTAKMHDGKTKGGSRGNIANLMHHPYVVFSHLWDVYRQSYNEFTNPGGNTIGGSTFMGQTDVQWDWANQPAGRFPQHVSQYYDYTQGLSHPWINGGANFSKEEERAITPLFDLVNRGMESGANQNALIDMISSSYVEHLAGNFFNTISGQTDNTSDAVLQNQNLVRQPDTNTDDLMLLDFDQSVGGLLDFPSKVINKIVTIWKKVPKNPVTDFFGNLLSAIGYVWQKVSETITSVIDPRLQAQLGFRFDPPGPIIGASVSYGRGGLLHGPDHAHGGKAIYAEGGEYIVNKNATRKNLGLLQRINYEEGGTTYNPASNFARQDIDFTRSGDYFTNVQESIQNLTQGEVGDITNIYQREAELNRELTDLFTELADAILTQLAEIKDSIFNNLDIQLTAINVLGENVKTNITWHLRSNTENQDAYMYNYFSALNENLNGVGDMVSQQFNLLQSALFLNFMSTTKTIGDYISQLGSKQLTSRALEERAPMSGAIQPNYMQWTNEHGQTMYSLGPNYKDGGLVSALKYAEGGSTNGSSSPTLAKAKDSKSAGPTILSEVQKNNADLFTIAANINTNLSIISEKISAIDMSNFKKIEEVLGTIDSNPRKMNISRQVYDNWDRITGLEAKFDQSPGGIAGGVVGGVVGVINSVTDAIFSDRSAKSFRSGGMTESQQTDVLRKVQPHTFRYKSGGPVQTGFMAQDLERTSFGRQFVHNSPAGKYVDGGIIGPLLASQSIMQSRMDSYQGGGVVAPSGISEALLQGIIDAIRDQDMSVNVYTNTEDEVGQMLGSESNTKGEANYREVSDYT